MSSDYAAGATAQKGMRRTWLIVVLSSAAFVVIAAGGVIYSFGFLSKPLGPGPALQIASPNLSDREKLDFLNGNFHLVDDVRGLPAPIVQAFTEEGGKRLTIVNPGKRFRATDVVIDPSLPDKRLVLAGVSKDKCFVEFEEGGWALSRNLILFRISSPNEARAVWRGGCWGTTLQDIQEQIRKGNCSGGY